MAENNDGSATRRRGPGKRFQKGQSGNPGGRPAIPADVRQAFKDMTPDAARALFEALSEGGPVAVQAAKVILDRGWGQAPQRVEFTLDNLTDEELDREIARLEAAASCATPEGGEDEEGGEG